jgi:hypothetical protein
MAKHIFAKTGAKAVPIAMPKFDGKTVFLI